MPRRRKRFSFLEKALKAAGGTASAGVLAEFANFKAGINKANVGTVDPNARKAVGYGIIPFGRDLPATPVAANYQKIRISVFSNGWRTTAGFTNAALGYDTTNYAAANGSSSFYPATAKIFVATGASANAISGITKRSYKKMPGDAYSLPFGAHVADAAKNSEFEQQAAITAIVGALQAPSKSVSFMPEQLSKSRAEPSVGT